MTTGGSTLKDKLRGLYAEHAESWKADQDEAMASSDLEDHLALGLFIFRSIEDEAREYQNRLARGLSPYDPEVAKAIRAEFSTWLSPCEVIEGHIRRFEQKGYIIKHAEQFRTCYLRVRRELDAGVDIDALVAAAKDIEEHGTIPLTQAIDELQGRPLP